MSALPSNTENSKFRLRHKLLFSAAYSNSPFPITLPSSSIYSLPPAYVYRKDERALRGNIQSRNCLSPPVIINGMPLATTRCSYSSIST